MKSRRRYFDLMVRFSWASLGLLWSVIRFCFRVFAANYRVTENRNSGEDALEYGVLNYRTNHLDDGTDPDGWYSLD